MGNNVVELRPNKYQEDAWKLMEEINVVQQEQEKIWDMWADKEQELMELTGEFDEVFRKLVKKQGYSNIPALFCEYTSLVIPTVQEDGTIGYMYADPDQKEKNE
jgi:thymidylate synthase